ncbi:MAG: hypothetical protein ACLFTO_05770 [Candidatus Acetothermia bacterium]
MGYSKLKKSVVVFFLVGALFLLHFPATAVEGINPLRLGEDQKAWQMTLEVSRYLEEFTTHTGDSGGLWKEKKKIEGTLYSLKSSFDFNESLGFEGGLTYRSSTTKSDDINLWSGKTESSEETEGELQDATLKMKLDIWENSEMRTYFSIPVLGGPAAAGLVWSRDPVMVFPKIVTDGSLFGLNTGVSFVANSKMAFNGNVSWSYEEGDSTVVFTGGLVYRDGEYDGVQVSASIREGASTRVSVELGLSYGEEK